MDHQLRLPLSLEDLYPVLSRRSATEVEEDNRIINELIRKFGITKGEAIKLYFTCIKHSRKGGSQ